MLRSGGLKPGQTTSKSRSSRKSSPPFQQALSTHQKSRSRPSNRPIKKPPARQFFTLFSKSSKSPPLSTPLDSIPPERRFDFSEDSQHLRSTSETENTPTAPTSSLQLPYKFHQAVLSNGINVITHSQQFPISHIAVSFNHGSRVERKDRNELGLTHFLERSLLRATTNRTMGTMLRDMAKLGADFSTSSSRESFIISATTPSRINPVLGTLADLIKNPAFDIRDLIADKPAYFMDTLLHEERRDVQMNNAVHAAAWGASKESGLGQRTVLRLREGDKITTPRLKRWFSKIKDDPKNITISAVNVNHDSFVELAEEMFGCLELQSTSESPLRKLCEVKEEGIAHFNPRNIHLIESGYSGNTHMILYWPSPSLLSLSSSPSPSTAPNSTNQQPYRAISSTIFASTVLVQLLGSGAPFSQGGPGKGLYSRLQQFVNNNTWISNIEAFQINYTDAGLMGIYSIVPPDAVGWYLDQMGEELVNLSKTITEEEVDRAKNMLTTKYLEHLSSSLYRCEEAAKHVQLYGSPQFQTYLDGIQKVSIVDVRNVAGELFLMGTPNIVTFGDAEQIPKHLTFDHLLPAADDAGSSEENDDDIADGSS